MRPLALTLIIFTMALGLSACQTMTPEERRAADSRQCLSYGFKRGTDGFATCLQRIDIARQAQADYNSDALMRNMAYDLNGPFYGGGPYYRRYR
ncbi:hypothetical protein [Rhizobium sp. Root1220]|uniref:hypothetical protein n=1 Tax=Rhizobium sp. Root1220 TaxID=1736432 RepID=UPI0007019EB6|nr:hypothetical protein [Rhizobium sp. Root1220]KQV68129.1 hypothetical protein ASC90_10790 [Rhizobium sp. Root1220]